MATASVSREPARLPLLCESREGYQNLCQLITQFKMRERPSVKVLRPQRICSNTLRPDLLTGGDEGPLAAALMCGGKKPVAKREATGPRFGRKNVYVELQRHREREEEWRNQAAVRIARF